jgi:hypothetical protein
LREIAAGEVTEEILTEPDYIEEPSLDDAAPMPDETTPRPIPSLGS